MPVEDRFKFVDDLSTLEIINLLAIGMSSFNVKQQVPSDIPTHGQYIPAENLKSQKYLDWINEWTDKQKMIISEKKTKAMIFNYTNNHQFTTRLELKGQNVEIVQQMKILGTVINSDLSWNDNCDAIIKKVNARMSLLRNVYSFGATTDEMVHMWVVFCRSVVEQSCVVWHSSLTQENSDDIERTQKTFSKMILKEKYIDYENALTILNLDSLKSRRQLLCEKFAKSGIKHNKLSDLLQENEKHHQMVTREFEKYNVQFANTNRLKNSSIINMQHCLNEDIRRKTNYG